MKKFLLGTAVAVTLISTSSAFADSGNNLSAFDGIPSESVQATELDGISGKASRLQNAFGSVQNMITMGNLAKQYGDLTLKNGNYYTSSSLNTQKPQVVYQQPSKYAPTPVVKKKSSYYY